VSDPYLDIRGLSKSFGLKPILRKVDLQVYAGERVALLGANGTGKTTLLRILACLTRATAGTVTIAGLDLALQTREVRRGIGFVAHQPYLYEELTALENLLFFARMYDVERPQERALALLARVGLSKKARERASSLSRGQTQRLALARALLHAPSFLLLDEPETGLDQDGRALLRSLLAEHRARGGTTLFTTHELEHGIAQSDRVIMLHHGRVVYQQETEGQETADILQVYQEATG
jgi:heme ABC exporter ATP-binding subunit CcmA